LRSIRERSLAEGLIGLALPWASCLLPWQIMFIQVEFQIVVVSRCVRW